MINMEYLIKFFKSITIIMMGIYILTMSKPITSFNSNQLLNKIQNLKGFEIVTVQSGLSQQQRLPLKESVTQAKFESINELPTLSDSNHQLRLIIVYANNASHCQSIMDEMPEFKEPLPNEIYFINYQSEIQEKVQCPSKNTWYFQANSNIYAFDRRHEVLFELYVLNGIYHVKEHSFFHWLPEFPYNLMAWKATIRGNFEKSIIKVLALNTTYQYSCILGETQSGQITLAGGVCKRLIETLAFTLNFNYKVVTGGGDWIPKPRDHGTLTGMASPLNDGQADISANFVIMHPKRVRGLDFLQPSREESPECFFFQPKPRKTNYIKQFKSSTWASFHFTWLFILIAIILISKTSQRYLDIKTSGSNYVEDDAILWWTTTITQQGSSFQTKYASTRIAVIISLFFGLVTYLAYSASLVSNLSSQIPPFQTVKDLIQGDLEVVTDNISQSLQNLLGIIYNESGVPMVKDKQVHKMSTSMAINKMFGKKFESKMGFISYPNNFMNTFLRSNYNTDEFCKVHRMKVDPKILHLQSLVLKKRSPYKELFQHRIIFLKELGLTKRAIHIYNEEEYIFCSKLSRDSMNSSQLDMHDVGLPFIIVAVGILSSLMVLIVEIYFKKIAKEPQNFALYD